MIINEPNYQKAIDVITKVVKLGKLSTKDVKDLNCLKAGWRAEGQVAYQLKSFFGSDEELCVFNNFSFVHNDQNCQIDHLVFSRRAIYLIESKSVLDVITVNEYDEWFRGKSSKPMKSPVYQLARQQEMLMYYLVERRKVFLGKILGLQKGLAMLDRKCFVAISEKGKISGKGREKYKDIVIMVDAIASQIKAFHKLHDGSKLKAFFKEDHAKMNAFSKEEYELFKTFMLKHSTAKTPMVQVEDFLAKRNLKISKSSPITAKQSKTVAMPTKKTIKTYYPQPTCKYCQSNKVTIEYGRNYYLKCQACEGNTPIKLACNTCESTMRIRKQKINHYLACETCETEVLYFQA